MTPLLKLDPAMAKRIYERWVNGHNRRHHWQYESWLIHAKKESDKNLQAVSVKHFCDCDKH